MSDNRAEVWESAVATRDEADRRKAANDAAQEGGGEDMFARAGVAAE